MSIISDKKIDSLNEIYLNFCKAVNFRENEGFYTEYPSVFELSYNENPLGSGQLAKESIRRHSDFGHRYPPLGYSVLINELAKRLRIDSNNIIISAGSIAAIQLAVSQFSNSGDKIIFSKSSMPWYKWIVLGNNSTPVEVPLKKDMNHNLESILKEVDKHTKVIILSNPHNPTGLYINENDLKTFLSKLPENVLLVIDQAYYEYQKTQENILLDMVNNVPNLMLTRTFSKVHGLAGLRVGYGIANPQTIKALKAKWLGAMPTISSISTYSAYHALFDEAHINDSRAFNNDLKQNIYELSQQNGIKFLKSEANFVLINIFDSVKNKKFFQKNNMAFTAGYFFGYPEWARLSFDKRKSELLEKLNKTFSEIREASSI